MMSCPARDFNFDWTGSRFVTDPEAAKAKHDSTLPQEGF